MQGKKTATLCTINLEGVYDGGGDGCEGISSHQVKQPQVAIRLHISVFLCSVKFFGTPVSNPKKNYRLQDLQKGKIFCLVYSPSHKKSSF